MGENGYIWSRIMNLKRMFSKVSMMHQQLLKVIANSLDPLFSFCGK